MNYHCVIRGTPVTSGHTTCCDYTLVFATIILKELFSHFLDTSFHENYYSVFVLLLLASTEHSKYLY